MSDARTPSGAGTQPQGDGEAANRKRNWIIGGVIAAVGVIIVAVLLLRNSGHGEHAAPTRDVPTLDGKWIRFSPAYAKRTKIKFAHAEKAQLSPIITVTGDVVFDPDRVAAVGSRIPGRVRRVLKLPGDVVKKGDVLAEIESAELGEAQAGVAAAKAHAEAASANEKREAALAANKVSSQRDAELARANAAAARAELVAAEQRVKAMGGRVGGEIGILQLTSPIDGKVVELHVARGQSVEPSHTAFRVADLGQVWIELAVFERDVGRIRAGDRVEISPQSNAKVSLNGKVQHVGDVIELDSRSADVRVEVDNDGSLRPGQSVLAKIHTARSGGTALLLPQAAVTSVDGKATVFVAHGETSVEPRAVHVGSRDRTMVEVLSGLEASDRVVVDGVFALKSEVFR